MNLRKALGLLLAAVFLFVITVPAFAWDGRKDPRLESRQMDHPWQDDVLGKTQTTKIFIGVIGPFTFTIHFHYSTVTKPTTATIPAPTRPTQPQIVKER